MQKQSNLLTIWHMADMQIELRVSGEGGQRYDEFQTVLQRAITQAKEEQPDVAVIAGDIYQFESTTGDEQKMFSWFLHEMLKIESLRRIVIIPGNHDVKQRHNAMYRAGNKTNVTDSIDSVVTAINNPRISYYQHTGIYKDPYFEINWAVWSQTDKWSAEDPKPAYSPWINNELPEGNVIELFHDPKKGARGFDGKISPIHENYKISLDDFKANTILAGDIHAPDIIWFAEEGDVRPKKLFTYCSSLVLRNYGEADYYSNFDAMHYGNALHGYNIVKFDLDKNEAIECEFFQVKNPVVRSTIYLDSRFDYAELSIKRLTSIVQKGAINRFRFVCKENIKSFVDNKQQIAQTFIDEFVNCSISFAYDSDLNDMEIDESLFEDLSTAIDKDKIFELAKSYVEKVINKTSTISKEDKEVAIEYLTNILKNQLHNVDMSTTVQRINLHSVEVRNFMRITDSIFNFTGEELNVISGANGTGKSTIMHLLNWINTDRISENQSMRDKKYNNLLYFNTASEDDEVYAKEIFDVDGIKHELVKIITRKWKTDKKDIKDPNWQENIKSVKVEIQLTIHSTDGIVVMESTEAEEELAKYFDFNTMQKLTLINGMTIHKLINSTPEEIAHDFLQIMGLDISSALLQGFDELKHKELDSLKKPAEKIEDIISEIASYEISREDINENKLIFSKEVETKNNDLSLVNAEIELTLATKIPCKSIVELNSLEKILIDEISILESNQIANSASLEYLKSSTENVSTINEKIHSENSKKMELNNLLTIESNKHSESKTIVANKYLELQQIANAMQLTVNKENEVFVTTQNALREKINSNNVEIHKFDIAKNGLLSTYKSTIINDKQALSTSLQIATEKQQNATTQKNQIVSQLAICQSSFATLENDKAKQELSKTSTCFTCNQLPSKESLIKFQENIDSIDKQLIAINASIAETNEKIQNAEEHIVSCKNAYDELQIKDSELNRLYANAEKHIQYTAEYVNIEKSKLAIDFENKTIQIEIDKLATQIELNNSTVQSRVKELPETTQLISEIGDENAKQSEILANIENDLNVQLVTINTEIDALHAKLRQATTIDEQIKNVENAITAGLIDKNQKDYQLLEIVQQKIIAEKNSLIDERLKPVIDKASSIKVEIENCNASLQKLNIEIALNDKNLLDKSNDLEAAKKYNLVEASMKLYKKIIGKDGLPQFVFAHLIPLINREFSHALSDVKFRLLFDANSLELRFYDIESQVSRPITFISGMERTASILIVTQIRRILNRLSIFNFLFIDEISGTLNDGKGLDYDALNYKEITAKYINRLSKHVPIYIIDHVLEFGPEATRIEVTPVEGGSIFVQK